MTPKKAPMRLAMKFGVSLQGTTPLPRCRSQNSAMNGEDFRDASPGPESSRPGADSAAD